MGPEGASVTALRADPSDGITIFAATDGAGVFKTTDAGASWQSVSVGLGNLQIQTLVVAPNDRVNLYAVTQQGALYKSTDAAASWTAISGGLETEQVTSIAISPMDSAQVYVGTAVNGVYKTADAGLSWQIQSAGLPGWATVSTLTIDPTHPSSLYAGVTGFGVYKSDDGGLSWTSASSGLTDWWPSAFLIDVWDPQTLYLGTESGGVFKSTDGAQTWTLTNTGLANLWVQALVQDSNDPSFFYAGTNGGGIFRSTDGAATWVQANNGLLGLSVSALVMSSSGSHELYAGTSLAGVFKSTDGAANWAQVNTGISNIYVYAVQTGADNNLYASTNGGIFKNGDVGQSWSVANNGLSDRAIRALVVDPLDFSVLYAGSYGAGVFKSVDAGVSWNLVSGTLFNHVTALVLDPANHATIFAGTFGGGVFRSLDGGNTWSAVNSGLSVRHVQAVSIDPFDSTVVFVATINGVFKSVNGGQSWTSANLGLTSTYVTSLGMDFVQPGTLYAGTSGGAFKSTDGGGTWAAINSGLTNTDILSLTIDPAISSVLYVGTSGGGVFKSTDGGANWIPINPGLANLNVNALKLNPSDPSILFAGTNGGGVFKVTMAPDLAVDPAALSLGSIPIGTTAQQTLTLTNTGMSDVHLNWMGVLGEDTEQFTITDNNCVAQGAALPLGASCSLKMNFAPISGGSKSAILEVISDAVSGATTTVPLTGVGLQYTLQVIGGAGSASGALTGGSAINCTVQANGTTTGACSESTLPGATITLTAAPQAGAHVGWQGCDTASGNTCTVTLNSDRSVRAAFNWDVFTVLPSSSVGGTLSPSTPQAVTYNHTKVFTVTAALGYHLGSVTGCGGTLSGNTYTTAPVNADCTVAATFAADPRYTLTIAGDVGTASGSVSGGSVINCSIAANGATSGVCGENVLTGTTRTLTAAPPTGATVQWQGCDTASGNTCMVTLISARMISVAFNWNTYTVTPNAGIGGTISPNTPQTVLYHRQAVFTVTPYVGFAIASVTGCGGVLSGNSYTIAPATSTCAITANFALLTFTVTPSAGVGGALSPATPQTVNYGATTAFTVTATPGYQIASLSGCDGTLSGSFYTTGPVTANCIVTAVFAINTFAISTTSESNGSVSCSPNPVDYNTSTICTISPTTGYHIDTVTVDGVSQSVTTPYIFNNVQTPHSISATFAINHYTISSSLTGSGAMSCDHETVSVGGSFECTLLPGSGYHLVSLLDNNVDVTAQVSGTKYAVKNVSANHNLQATFLQNPTVLRVWGDSAPYSSADYLSIMGAYSANTEEIPITDFDILTLASDFYEELSFDRNVSITLQGGCSQNFDPIEGWWTVLNGKLTISNGTVIIENLIIK